MSKVLFQFEKFYQENYDDLEIFEKRISSLIIENFKEIELLGTNQGKRGRKITSLITGNKNNIITKKEISKNDNQAIVSNFHLSNMEIENFRGFSTKETLDLSKNFTFVYGPNGTGKSCFCEALEYSLLGSIEEATTKKIPVNQYIKNVFTDSSKNPIVSIETEKGIEILEANPELFSFCFIERNRIENFSRIAADFPTGQQQKLSALFGLDEWNGFVKNFNSEISVYLVDGIEESQKYFALEEDVKKDNQFLKSFNDKNEELISQAKKIILKYENSENLKEFMEYVDGKEGKKGKISELEDLIKKKEKLKNIDLKPVLSLKEKINQLVDLNASKKENEEKLLTFKKEMSLKEFYQQILNSKVENKCPACLSDIYTTEGELCVPQDPYKKASSYLGQIQEAIKLEQKVKESNELVSILLLATKNLLIQVSRNIFSLKREKDCFQMFSNSIDEVIERKKNLEQLDFTIFINDVSKVEKEIIDYNETVTTASAEKNVIQKELESLVEDRKILSEIKGQFKLLASQEQEVKSRIDSSKMKLVNQKHLSDLEYNENLINEEYRKSYRNLLKKIVAYSQSLPLILISSLEVKVLELYNEINKNDFEGDKLHSVTLPKTSKEKILISFVDKPELQLDALLVLSEGHVRCLGLAILLSKIINDDLPLVIFDDVVNAIDDDHRTSIAELITSHTEICNRQCIVTTHGSNYIETLENKIPQKVYEEKVTRIIFINPIEKGKINVSSKISSANLLVKAQEHFEENDHSNCLTFCRKSVEKLSEDAWQLYFKISKKPIELRLRSKKDHPESSNIFNKLIKEFGTLNIDAFDDLITNMKAIVEHDKKNNILWTSMNAGTHHSEREFEFEGSQIRELLNLLKKSDEEINVNIKINKRGDLTYKGLLQELK